jgi:metallo-beta-lactamase family protein
MKISFNGAAGMVTGSQTRVEHFGYSFLVDCGLYQGPKAIRELNWNSPQDPEGIKAMILTHAHIDHSGLVPRWIAAGWRGPLFVTPATAKLLKIMLPDAARLQEEDAGFANRTHHSRHDPALPLYTENDAKNCFHHFREVDYDIWTKLTAQISFRFLRAGHILGSAILQIQWSTDTENRVLTFSGDLGGGQSEILKDPVRGLETDYLVLESTYGDRKIEVVDRDKKLAEIVNRVFSRKGTLVIPAFAVGRTQDLLLSLFKLKQQNKIPDVPIYLDSPMANSVTQIYSQYMDEMQNFGSEADLLAALTSPFFKRVSEPDQSMLLCMSNEPKIVISASGMLQGGRVLHHLKCKLPDAKSAVLFVGYQGSETKGRLLQNGILNLRIHHQEIPVESEIVTIEGYSAHADQSELLNWVKSFHTKPKKVFLNHGESEAQKVFAELIKNEQGSDVVVPKLGDSYVLE